MGKTKEEDDRDHDHDEYLTPTRDSCVCFQL
jgi:hypothetical protein